MSSTEQVDVVIVGAGVAGGAIAARLLESGGVRAVLLEQGPWIHDVDHAILREDWEFGISREWAFDPNVRRLDQDYPVTGQGFRPFLFNAVGGSSNHYAGFWHRMKPAEFRRGTEHGLENSIDWPISHEDLVPYYEENDRRFGISGLAGDPSHPPREPRQCPPLKHGRYYDLIAAGLDRLGWHWWPADNAIISEPYRGRLPCNHCGFCMAGCPRGSLGTATQAYILPATRRGLDLRTNARVARITTDRTGAVDGVDYIDRDTGAMHRIEAPLVVVACNGIGSPRLLLNSAGPGHPDGLANEHDQVGRNLITHAYVLADMWFDEPTEHYKGPWGAGLFTHEFHQTDLSRGAVNGMTITFGAGWGPAVSALGATTGLDPTPWGPDHRLEFGRRFDRHVFAAIQVDDLPRSDNRITLDPEVTDSSGLPAARRQYTLSDNDRTLLEFGTARLHEIAEASGARKVDAQSVADGYNGPGWHLMGTCRMGDSPEDSVVDAWHRAWGVPGLVVCDGSSMTTGGANNPTATIGALALRCAEGLVSNKYARVEAGAGA
ncbi:GMC family oxidoreductase [Geodermatophilus sp. SYSU D00703]